MSDPLVKIEGLSKKFSLSLKHSMLYGAQDIAKVILGIPPKTKELRRGEFWSLWDVSFQLRRGECMALIGPNGAGKSTLLKLLNGIISPDKGRIEIRGRVGALVELTAGFHPLLTGKENIYVNGAILGFSKAEIDRRFHDIVEFSELGDFINAPVKHYSSGMTVRLGFAIAAQMEPDVFLIDEVLAVGDLGFRTKCLNTIAEISRNAAIILVSHSMGQITRICSDICVLNHGKVTYIGKNVAEGIDHYYSQFEPRTGVVTGSGRATIHRIEFECNGKKNITEINHMDDLTIQLYVSVDPEIKFPSINLNFINQELQHVAQCTSSYTGANIRNDGEVIHVTLKLTKVNFNPGLYYVTVAVSDETLREILIQHHAAKNLRVSGYFVGSAASQLIGEWYFENALLPKPLAL